MFPGIKLQLEWASYNVWQAEMYLKKLTGKRPGEVTANCLKI